MSSSLQKPVAVHRLLTSYGFAARGFLLGVVYAESTPTARATHRPSVFSHQGFSQPLVPVPGMASSGLTLLSIVVARPSWRSNPGSAPPTAIELFGLGFKGSPTSLSTSIHLHLAVSGCRLLVRNLCTPRSSPHKCSSEFSVFPSQTS